MKVIYIMGGSKLDKLNPFKIISNIENEMTEFKKIKRFLGSGGVCL
ncbi:hypothetical protein [Clostridium kluyveri]|nr:hypothetical protein [Clostridium kluyveri]UZQ49153.1 hypothetical protein OP486_14455 [Clostridium kluyveri]